MPKRKPQVRLGNLKKDSKCRWCNTLMGEATVAYFLIEDESRVYCSPGCRTKERRKEGELS